ELALPPRILGVADAYWALRADRPYRPAFTAHEALVTIEAAAGRQFDAAVVTAPPEAIVDIEAAMVARSAKSAPVRCAGTARCPARRQSRRPRGPRSARRRRCPHR